MSKATSGTENSIDTPTPGAPAIETRRYARAVTDHMTVERVAPRLYTVENGDGEAYTVDVEGGACDCPDAEYRGDRYVCKHAIRASLASVIDEGTARTALVARVVAETAITGCLHEGRACNGPLAATSEGTIPCPGCIDAVRSDDTDEFDVWSVVVNGQGRGRGR